MSVFSEMGYNCKFADMTNEQKYAYWAELKRRKPEHYREVYRKWSAKNREKIRAKQRRYYHKDLVKSREKQRVKSFRFKERISAYGKKWREENKDRIRLTGKAYREKNRAAIHERIRVWTNKREKTNLGFLIMRRMRARTFYAVKTQNAKKPTGFGYDSGTLMAHLEKQFRPGMTWQNYGRRGWHIDHIIPCAEFDLTNPDHFKQCFALENLRPLWEQENIQKSDKVLPEFRHLLPQQPTPVIGPSAA